MDEDRCHEVEEIWRRMSHDAAISEHDFLTVAYWAYHAMPADRIRSTLFQLYMRAHQSPQGARH